MYRSGHIVPKDVIGLIPRTGTRALFRMNDKLSIPPALRDFTGLSQGDRRYLVLRPHPQTSTAVLYAKKKIAYEKQKG